MKSTLLLLSLLFPGCSTLSSNEEIEPMFLTGNCLEFLPSVYEEFSPEVKRMGKYVKI